MKKLLTPEELRNLRESLGLSQEFMAAQTGMAQPNYCRIELGLQSTTDKQMREFEKILDKEKAEKIVAGKALGAALHNQTIIIEKKSPLDWITPGSAMLIMLIGSATLATDLDQGVLEMLGAKSFSEVKIGVPAVIITLTGLVLTMWLFVITVNGICRLMSRMIKSIRTAIGNSRPVVYIKTASGKLKHQLKTIIYEKFKSID